MTPDEYKEATKLITLAMQDNRIDKIGTHMKQVFRIYADNNQSFLDALKPYEYPIQKPSAEPEQEPFPIEDEIFPASLDEDITKLPAVAPKKRAKRQAKKNVLPFAPEPPPKELKFLPQEVTTLTPEEIRKMIRAVIREDAPMHELFSLFHRSGWPYTNPSKDFPPEDMKIRIELLLKLPPSETRISDLNDRINEAALRFAIAGWQKWYADNYSGLFITATWTGYNRVPRVDNTKLIEEIAR